MLYEVITHEVGRLMGSNLLEESLVLAKEYHLPASVISILKQHNYKNELPQSSEAVIVMLSDNIITMYHFMKKQEKEVSIVKLIDNTFHMHFNKGTVITSYSIHYTKLYDARIVFFMISS